MVSRFLLSSQPWKLRPVRHTRRVRTTTGQLPVFLGIEGGGTRTVAQSLVHIAVAPRIWAAIVNSGVTTLQGFNFMGLFMANVAEEQKPRTKAEIIALLESEGEAYATLVAGLSDEALAVRITQPDGQSSKTLLETLLSPKEHEMHHRGQLMLVERQLGITPHLTRAMQERFAAMQAAKG